MPYVEVWVDASDDLDNFSDDDLKEELAARAKRKNVGGSIFSADYRIPDRVAKYTLQEAADIFRKQGRNDLAFKLDEISVDFVSNV